MRLWADAREECEACGGSGEGGPQGPDDGAKVTKGPGVLACLPCRGLGHIAVEVELEGLATGTVRVRRPA